MTRLTKEFFEGHGYAFVRQLPDGRWVGVTPMLYSWRVVAGMDRTGWSHAWDFNDALQAKMVAEKWDFEGKPPIPYIKHYFPGGEDHGAAYPEDQEETT